MFWGGIPGALKQPLNYFETIQSFGRGDGQQKRRPQRAAILTSNVLEAYAACGSSAAAGRWFRPNQDIFLISSPNSSAALLQAARSASSSAFRLSIDPVSPIRLIAGLRIPSSKSIMRETCHSMTCVTQPQLYGVRCSQAPLIEASFRCFVAASAAATLLK